ncbi:MAG: VanZ family protein [Lachnospiraceae bacterium]|nr:VanZ family protein [Lachnospiraceae bacterium]
MRSRTKKKSVSLIAVRLLLFIYILILVRLIVFKYPIPILRGIMDNWDVDMVRRGVYSANLRPFKTVRMYVRYFHQINGFDNLFGNIFAFLPFGMLLPLAFEDCSNVGYVLLHSFWLSLGIEIFQLISHFGEFDVDDIILNCLGALLGYICYRIGQFLLYGSAKTRKAVSSQK